MKYQVILHRVITAPVCTTKCRWLVSHVGSFMMSKFISSCRFLFGWFQVTKVFKTFCHWCGVIFTHYSDIIVSVMAYVSNHRCLDCLPNRFFRRRSQKTSKLRVTGLCEGNSPVTSEFFAQRASNLENISIWWRHHVTMDQCLLITWAWL